MKLSPFKTADIRAYSMWPRTRIKDCDRKMARRIAASMGWIRYLCLGPFLLEVADNGRTYEYTLFTGRRKFSTVFRRFAWLHEAIMRRLLIWREDSERSVDNYFQEFQLRAIKAGRGKK